MPFWAVLPRSHDRILCLYLLAVIIVDFLVFIFWGEQIIKMIGVSSMPVFGDIEYVFVSFCIIFNKVNRFSIDGLKLHLLAAFCNYSSFVKL